MTSVWCLWIFQTTLRWKAFILFLLPPKGTALQWPCSCSVWMVGPGPAMGVLSWWEEPTCPSCICATCESGSCRYVDGTAHGLQTSGMFGCPPRWFSCSFGSNAFLHFVLCSDFSGDGVFLFQRWNRLASFQGPHSVLLCRVGIPKDRVLTWPFFVSAHLSGNSELLQICWANTDNQHFRPYLGWRQSGPDHRR